jgi:hypothetical protein
MTSRVPIRKKMIVTSKCPDHSRDRQTPWPLCASASISYWGAANGPHGTGRRPCMPCTGAVSQETDDPDGAADAVASLNNGQEMPRQLNESFAMLVVAAVVQGSRSSALSP